MGAFKETEILKLDQLFAEESAEALKQGTLFHLTTEQTETTETVRSPSMIEELANVTQAS
ncbi:MAG TPA: hypothetical protein VF412_05205 [Bdellovibrio sp.]|uniref:hypothetical protein n=1 Tax=Bdellovibrio sp. TaxID=28201 RepID=UPI002EDDB307